MKQRGEISDDDLEMFDKEIAAEITHAIEAADAADMEPVEDLTRFVYSPRPA
ncbi:MAG TPA: hypothetical protein VF933_09895 [Streptosporangiaceae bacterium]